MTVTKDKYDAVYYENIKSLSFKLSVSSANVIFN